MHKSIKNLEDINSEISVKVKENIYPTIIDIKDNYTVLDDNELDKVKESDVNNEDEGKSKINVDSDTEKYENNEKKKRVRKKINKKEE